MRLWCYLVMKNNYCKSLQRSFTATAELRLSTYWAILTLDRIRANAIAAVHVYTCLHKYQNVGPRVIYFILFYFILFVHLLLTVDSTDG